MEEDRPKANDLYIPAGVTFVGTIHAPGLAEINGSVTGEITSNKLDIERGGQFQGDMLNSTK
jgi:cytoskeletal protein CcmA (bactofilin family)